MPNAQRIVSSVLLAAGILLVFAGVSSALGFTPWSMLASAAAIAALLYSGAAWFAGPGTRQGRVEPAGPPLFVFDREGRIVSGPAIGQPLPAQFPEPLRGEIERQCAAALAGSSGRFPCLFDGRPVVFDALPVRNAEGAIEYGILVRSQASPAAVASA